MKKVQLRLFNDNATYYGSEELAQKHQISERKLDQNNTAWYDVYVEGEYVGQYEENYVNRNPEREAWSNIFHAKEGVEVEYI